MTNQAHITNKQQNILHLIYRYRFIDRIQIQALMHHKDRKRIGAWLRELRQNGYIEWIYDPNDFANKTKPAIYYLGLNGIRCLRETKQYPKEEIRKRYREAYKQKPFIARCQIIADCGINLEAQSINGTHYTFVTAADYADPENEYNFLADLKPHLCFVKEAAESKNAYLLEIFDSTTPRYMVKKRLNDYIAYITSSEWESETKDNDSPVILIACPSLPELTYAKRRTNRLLEGIKGDDTHIRFATLGSIKLHGVTGMIWEEVE